MIRLHVIGDFDFAKGGPGSGYYGHAGRPGEVGGSAAAGTALVNGKDRRSNTSQAIRFPSSAELEAGKWDRLNVRSSAVNVWKVTTKDGKEWFVKQPSTNYVRDESQSEVAGYFLANELGIPAIPTMALSLKQAPFLDDRLFMLGEPAVTISPWMDIDGKDGVLFAGFRGDIHDLPIDEVIKVHLFDYVIRNTDRHSANVIIRNDNSLLVFDHGLAFDLDKPFGDGGGFRRKSKELYQDASVDSSVIDWLRAGIASAREKTPTKSKLRLKIALASSRVGKIAKTLEKLETDNVDATGKMNLVTWGELFDNLP